MINSRNTFFVDSIELTKIDVRELQVGMYVSELDRPWTETNFLFQGFELKNEADVQAVQEQCSYVFIDVKKQTKVLQPKSSSRGILFSSDVTPVRKQSSEKKRLKEEIHQAGAVHREVSTVVKNFMQEVSLGRGIDVVLAKDVVAACVDSIVKAPDAAMWLTQLKRWDEYTSQHSMNVAIFAIALGRQFNLSVPELNNLGLCGMMHDMGKMKVPIDILNKPGRLTPEESTIMNSHATLGWQILLSSRNMYGGAIDVAYTHHEKMNGMGYPRGLTADRITPYARMVTIVDMYDAITSDRVYQKGRTHLEAISIMTQNGGTHLDADFTVKFIDCLGIYPPGNLIEMTNGEVAVVIETNPAHKLKPKVVFLLDEDKQPRINQFINLAETNLDRSGKPYRIKKIVRATDYNIDLNEFYREYLLD
jgi:HD-GYP domain-containing protein (c-di-GMP phosphodiesterase class II)